MQGSDGETIEGTTDESLGLAPLGALEAEVAEAGPISRTIDYTYDALYRLISADYDTGEFFHYTYDRAGNRLTQETHHLTSNTYVYDAAREASQSIA